MTTPKTSSTRILWVVAAVVAASACVCGGFVLASSGLLLMLAPWQGRTVAAIQTPTPAPISLGTWREVPDLPRQVNVFLFDPKDPNRVYAGTGEYGQGSGLYRSDDGGVTWQLAVAGLPDEPVMALALNADSSVLYANLAVDETIYASTDGAQTWHAVGTDSEVCCNVPRQLWVAPDDPQRLYLLQPAADSNLSISTDGGATWARVADPREELQPQSMAIDPDDPSRLYLGTLAHGVYVSTDRGETWEPANTGMVDYAITALATSPTEAGVVYAGSGEGELFVTRDAGATWTDLTDRLGFDAYATFAVLQIAVDPRDNSVEAVISLAGVVRSTDGGQTWSRVAVPAAKSAVQFPQDIVFGWSFAPGGRTLLSRDYPDGTDSGCWVLEP